MPEGPIAQPPALMKLLVLIAFYFNKLCDNEDKQREKDAVLQALLTFKKLGILLI